mmetsp:Transcript_29830/g.65222  ORF Transcript_29830/g.65222 Transcript_29830/m.65222 type:complete len:117 (-) Transcript_29830:4388-4738(-)
MLPVREPALTIVSRSGYRDKFFSSMVMVYTTAPVLAQKRRSPPLLSHRLPPRSPSPPPLPPLPPQSPPPPPPPLPPLFAQLGALARGALCLSLVERIQPRTLAPSAPRRSNLSDAL